eukprot:gene9808-10814_t
MSWRIKVKSCINGLLYAPGVNPLSPLLLLAFFMGTFANSMVLAMPFTFLPRLMKDFNIKEVEVGKYVGITASSLYIGRTLTSTTFSWAFTTRFLQGFLGGTAIALVTCAFGVCDETNSSIGNSFLLGGYSIGLIIGPAIGGLISFPSEKFPNTFKKGSFFDKFPVLLPVMVSVLALCVALMLAYLYIPESVRKGSMNEKTNLLQHSNPSTNASNKRNGTEKKHKWNCWSKFKEASFFKLMRQQPVVLAIILYSLVAFYETGFDDLLPIFADSPIKYGKQCGLGFSTEKIGYAIILSSIPVLFLTFVMGRIEKMVGMRDEFNIKEVEVGKYVGITASSFYAGKALTSFYYVDFDLCSSYFWGWLCDKIGAIIALKACVYGVCDKANSSTGYSFLLGGYSTGLLIGPAIGGLISFPSEKFPNMFKKDSFFDKFPVLLPIMVNVLFLCIGFILTYLYIPESVRKDSMNENTNLLQDSNPSTNASNKRNGTQKKHKIEEKRSTLSHFQSVSVKNKQKWNCWSKFKDTSFFRLMRQQPVVLTIALYSFVSFTQTGFDDLLPIFADSPTKYGGLGFSTDKIGYAIILSSIPVLFLTFVMGRIEKMVGIRDLNFIVSIVLVFILPLFPYVGALNPSKFWYGLLPALIVMRAMLAFSLFTSNVFVNNSVHPDYLGSVNGISMTSSCTFRAVSPSLLGSLYSWALDHKDKNRFPFNHFLPFFLCSIAVLIVIFMTAYIPKDGILFVDVKETGSSANLANRSDDEPNEIESVMKRLSKRLGLGSPKENSSQTQWTKYDARLLEGIEKEDLAKVKSAMRKPEISCLKQDANGVRALHLACMKGLGAYVKIMLKVEKPDLSTVDSNGRTALHLAARSGSEDCINYLLHYKSPVDIQDASSMTPLHYAVSGGHETPTYLLLRSGAPVNPKDKEGRTPLIHAAQGSDVNIVDLLCESGAHLNIQDNAGRTALMFACENGMLDIVNALLMRGADIEIEDFSQNTAEMLASFADRNEIVEVLKNPPHTTESHNGIAITNGHENKVCDWDAISELDESAIGDELSSFDDRSILESLSECSPRSPDHIELGKFESSSLFNQLNSLKSELESETMKRTNAEDEIRTLRMQLEVVQASEENADITFSEQDAEDILIAIEKSVPSPFTSAPEDLEDSPIVSALRGEIHALEAQIGRLKKEIDDGKKEDDNQVTKIPLTVYRALKEAHEELKKNTTADIEKLKEELSKKPDIDCVERQRLQRKVDYYKELYEKSDKSEKIRELNEQIVSLKIQISKIQQLKDEDESFKSEADHSLEYPATFAGKSNISDIKAFENQISQLTNSLMAEKERHKIIVAKYRNILMSTFQGDLNHDLKGILAKIIELRSFEKDRVDL